MQADGSLHLDIVRKYVDTLISDGIEGLYVCGTTGEGQALTSQERKDTAAEFIQAADGRVPVAVHVGHNSLRDARALASHAAESGATAISAMLPTHTAGGPVETRADILAFIAEAAPEHPFVFYHMANNNPEGPAPLMEQALAKIPTVAGVKFTDSRIHELQACLEVGNGRLTMFFGMDEMLAGGLIAGAHSAIGSTYNFAAPLYLRVIDAVDRGDIAAATKHQATAARMIRAVLSHGNLSAQKEIMNLIGVECGPCRLPQPPLTNTARLSLAADLDQLGFHDWAR